MGYICIVILIFMSLSTIIFDKYDYDIPIKGVFVAYFINIFIFMRLAAKSIYKKMKKAVGTDTI